MYYLKGGGLTLSGQASLLGANVIIYNAPNNSNDAIKITGNGIVNLTPPTSGTYKGIAVFQDRTSTAIVQIAGNGTVTIGGVIYAAKAFLDIGGNGNSTIGTQLIGYDLTPHGNGAVFVNPDFDATKFYVADSAAHATFFYDSTGLAQNSANLASGTPMGIASSADGTKQWVVDSNGKIYVYNNEGGLLGSWAPGQVTQPTDIAVNGNDIWVVDAGTERVYLYQNAVGRLTGSQAPLGNFALDAANQKPSGLAVSGNTLWVTDDNGAQSQVFVYSTVITPTIPSITGTKIFNWSLDANNSDPSGITLNPTGGSDLWVVDRTKARIYHYASAMDWRNISQVRGAQDTFALAVGDLHPEGIADPPPTLTVQAPAPSVSIPAFGPLLITGQVQPGNAPVSQISLNGTAVDVVDAAGNFFTKVAVDAGQNNFTLGANDSVGQSTSQTLTVVGSEPVAPGKIDFSTLSDVTASFSSSYGQTSFDDGTKVLYADLSAQNIGNFGIDTPILVGVTHISVPTVRLRDNDGTTPTGMPYYDYSSLINGHTVNPAANIGTRTIAFYDPDGLPFTYDLVFLGHLNQPPRFTSVPVVRATIPDQSGAGGLYYTYQATAVDPESDTLHFRKLSGPDSLNIDQITGMATWSPTATDAGNHEVILEVDDGRGGTAKQEFVITAATAAGNLPPYFTSTPVVDANVNTPYVYTATAADADGDTPLNFSVLSSPDGFTIDQYSGVVTWVPTAAELGVQDVKLRVKDTADNTAIQEYEILVQQKSGNNAPVIVTTPQTHFNLPGVSNPPDGQVGPAGIDLSLDPGVTTTQTVSLVLPAGLLPPVNPNAPPPPTNVGVYHVGDVFAGVGNGQARQYSPDGTLLRTLDTLQGTVGGSGVPYTTGMAFDASSNLYLTVFSNSNVARFDTNGQLTTPTPFVTDDANSHNESIVFDAAGNFFVGQADGTHNILEMSPDGTLVNRFQVSTQDRGSDWIDLAGDQHTIYYTSEGNSIFRFDTSTSAALPDFADNLPGANAYALRILPDGGVLVADTQVIVRLDAAGNVMQTYSVPNESFWFALNLDPDGTSFWSGDYNTGDVYKFNIASGQVESMFITVPGGLLNGLTVFGEHTAAQSAARIPIEVVATDPNVSFVNQSGIVQGVSGFQVTFNTQWTGDGAAHSFDLLFVRTDTGAVVGSLPVTLNNHYGYTVHAVDPDSDPITYTILAAPEGTTINSQTGQLNWEPTQAGTYHFSLMASDGRGGQDVQTYDVTVDVGDPNLVPTITSMAPGSAIVGQTYTYSVVANDADNDSLTYFLAAGDPPGMQIDRSTGVITWTPTSDPDQTGPQSATVKVLDGHGGQVSQTFTITVTPPTFVNQPPHINSTAPITAIVGEHYRYFVSATDPDADVLTFDLPVKPAGMGIDPRGGFIIWTPTPDEVGSQPVLVRVRDANGAVNMQSFNVSVALPNQPPVISSTPPLPAVVNQPYQYAVQAQDADTGDVLTYGLDMPPNGMSIGLHTGILTWTPTQAGRPTVTVTVTDLPGAITRQTFVLPVVVPAAPAAPVVTSGAPASATVGQPFQYQIIAHDPQGAPLNYSLTPPIAGINLDPRTGLLTWTPSAGDAPSQHVVIAVTDGLGASTQLTLDIPVALTSTNQPPTITSQPPGPAVVGDPYSYQVTATDPDGDPLTFSVPSSTAPSGMQINANTGLLTWTPGASGTVQFDVIADDHRGGTYTQHVTLGVVQDAVNQPPAITSTPPGPAAVGDAYQYQVVASDPNGDPLTYRLDTAPAGMTINDQNGLVTWIPEAGQTGMRPVAITVTDGRGAGITQSFQLQTEVVSANGVPTFVTQSLPGPALANSPYQAHVVAQDDDGDPLTYSLTSAPTGVSIDSHTGLLTWTPLPAFIGVQTVSVAVTDGRGGQALNSFTLTVANNATNHPPTIGSQPPGPAVVGDAYQYQVMGTDPDGDPIQFRLTGDALPAGINLTSTGLLTWTPGAADATASPARFAIIADDGRGGIFTQSVTLNVIQGVVNHPPLITSTPAGTAFIDQAYTYQAEATDPDGDPVAFRLQNAPEGVTIDAATGLLNWTPSASQAGPQSATLVAEDGRGGETLQNIAMQVIEAPVNGIPVITSTPRDTVQIGQRYLYIVAASDTDGDPLTYSLPVKPTGMAISVNGVVSWTPTQAAFGDNSVEVRVDDGRGGFKLQDFMVTVVTTQTNDPPTFTSTPPLDATVGEPYTYNLTGDDQDGDALDWHLVHGPVGMSLDPMLGTLRWTPTSGQVGNQDVNVQLIDSAGSTVPQTFTIRVRGVNLPPHITSQPPPTVAGAGQSYVYPVAANDADGDPMHFTLLTYPAGMSIDPSFGLIRWTAGAPGVYSVEVQVDDGLGLTDTQSYSITVSATNYQPPVITSQPSQVGAVGLPYQYQVHAIDPNGLTLQYALDYSQSPADMTITSTGLVQWSPLNVSPGQNVRVVVTDTAGLSVDQGYLINVTDNLAPHIDSTAVTTVTAGLFYEYDVQAADDDTDALTYALTTSRAGGLPQGLSIDQNGIISWQTATTDVGTLHLVVTVTDPFGVAATQPYDLAVQAETTSPQVDVEITGNNPLNVGSTETFMLLTSDEVAVTSQTLTLTNTDTGAVTNIPVDGTGQATLRFTTPGHYTVTGTATNPVGITATATQSLRVLDPNVNAPQITLPAPNDGNAITAPTAITGTITGDSTTTWSVELISSDGTIDRTIASGTGPLNNATLTTFDPTMLANDSYTLRVSASDAGGDNSVDAAVNVAGHLKLGDFSMSFTDLTVPLAGIPITITRTYNTLNANEIGDFSYGWTLSFGNAQLRVNLVDGAGAGWGGYPAFLDGTRVYVTFPNGDRQGFTFQPYETGYDDLGLITYWHPNFVPDQRNTMTLSVPDVLMDKDPDSGEYTFVTDGGDLETYNPQNPAFGNQYTLTDLQGTKSTVNATTGDLQTVNDRRGNTLTFSDTGIQSSSGVGVIIARDPEGRIISVTDPAGKQVRYTYSAAGDLASVTNRIGGKTQFTYRTDAPHYLDTATDPLGHRVASTLYDASGRIIAVTDAAGAVQHYSFNTSTLTNVITDPLGHTTTRTLDSDGNILREVDATGVVTAYTYDTQDDLLTKAQVIGNNTLTVFTNHYDSSGNVTATTDVHGNTTYKSYGPYGEVLTESDPYGNTTNRAYDGVGNELSYTDPNGNGAHFSYDNNGNPTGIVDLNGNTLMGAATYDNEGDVVQSTSNGRTAYHANTPDGDEEASWYFEGTGSSQVEYLDITYYDDEGEVTGTKSYAIPTAVFGPVINNFYTTNIPTQYLSTSTTSTTNVAGLVTSEVGADGVTTETTYDVNDREIESRTQLPEQNGQMVWQVVRTVYDADGRVAATTDPYIENSGAPITGFRTIYDDAGRVLEVDHLSGMVVDITGAAGSQQSVLTSAGTLVSSASTQYDSDGRPVVAIDPFGRQALTTYNSTGDVVESRQQSFDQNSQQVWIVKRTVYDELGRESVTTDPYVEGSNNPISGTQTVYGDSGRVVQTNRLLGVNVSLANGETAVVSMGTQISSTSTTYDSQGRVANTIAPDGETTQYVYDSYGRQIATIGSAVPVAQVGLIGYAAGTLVALRSESAYDSKSRVFQQTTNILQLTNPNGSQSIDYSQARTESYMYDGQDNLLQTTYADGTTTSAQYDIQNRVVAETDQLGNVTEMKYDQQSRLTVVSLPAVPDPILRDAANNPLMVRPRWQYQYDVQGDLVKSTDNYAEVSPSNIQTEPGNGPRSTTYQYNSLQQQTSRLLPIGNTEQDQYDLQGRPTVHITFEGVVEQSVYDDSAVGGGHVTETRYFASATDFKNGAGTPNETVNYVYDAFGRVISTTYHRINGTVDTYATQYDTLGRITQQSSPTGNLNYEYDNLDRERREWTATASAPNTVLSDTRYSYDPFGHMSTVQTMVRDGVTLAQPETTQYFYDLLGRPRLSDLPNGVVETYTFDNMDRLTQLLQANASGVNLAQFNYTYQADGKETRLAESFWFSTNGTPVLKTATYVWTYDNDGRMTSETVTDSDHTIDQTESFTWDLVGNRINETIDFPSAPEQVISSQFDANDRLLQDTTTVGGTLNQTTTYDWGITSANPNGVTQELGHTVKNAAGVIVSRQQMGYNLQGELASVILQSFDGAGQLTADNRITYQYDPAGLRTLTVDAIDASLNGTYAVTSSTEYLFDTQSLTGQPQCLMETEKNAAGQVVQRTTYTFGVHEITQTVTTLDPSSGAITSTATQTFGHDGHGSVRALIDVTSSILQAYMYAAYGNLLAIRNAAGSIVSSSLTAALTNVLYAGQTFDRQTGWQFLRARWYNPSQGRFDNLDTSAGDRMSPLSLNKYAYTSGDPINYADPTGHDGDLISLGISMSIGSGQRGGTAGSVLSAYNFINKAIEVVEFIYFVIELLFAYSEEGVLGAIKVLGVDPNELQGMYSTLQHDVLPLITGAGQVPGDPPTPLIGFNFPKSSGTGGGRIGKSFRLALKLLAAGGSRSQKIIGDVGTALIANLVGFQGSGALMTRPPNKVNGPDFVMQHREYTSIFGIFEAKGGTSRLGTSRLVARPFPSGWVAPGGAPFPQMGKVWLNFWLRKYIDYNPGGVGLVFRRSWNLHIPMLTGVVSLDMRRPHHQFEMSFQIFIPKNGLFFDPWPSALRRS